MSRYVQHTRSIYDARGTNPVAFGMTSDAIGVVIKSLTKLYAV